MKKNILITGSSDGIGLLSAKKFLLQGHKVILHGKNEEKVKQVIKELEEETKIENIDYFIADLSSFEQTVKLASYIKSKYSSLDILINNAGVFNVDNVKTQDNLDIRFVVNTISPYLLTKELLSVLDENSRVINLSSAAQASVNLEALKGEVFLSNSSEVYAQSKLGLTMWSFEIAKDENIKPIVIAVNPKSFLASKMVKDAYGISGVDLNIGADILYEAALSKEFAKANGKYFDNDIQSFSLPHLDALNEIKCKELINEMEKIISKYE